MWLFTNPVTVALFPYLIFAVWHATSISKWVQLFAQLEPPRQAPAVAKGIVVDMEVFVVFTNIFIRFLPRYVHHHYELISSQFDNSQLFLTLSRTVSSPSGLFLFNLFKVSDVIEIQFQPSFNLLVS